MSVLQIYRILKCLLVHLVLFHSILMLEKTNKQTLFIYLPVSRKAWLNIIALGAYLHECQSDFLLPLMVHYEVYKFNFLKQN